MRMGTAVSTSHRPTAAQCHHHGRRPDATAIKSDPQGSSLRADNTRRVLVAPIMHRAAFEFVKRLGEPNQLVQGCSRHGVIIPETRLKAFICAGGELIPSSRPVDQTFDGKEEIIPLVAVHPVYNGVAHPGQSYQVVVHSTA